MPDRKNKKKTFLVLSAHPDDETLGCGRLLYDLAQKTNPVFIVFATTGAAPAFLRNYSGSVFGCERKYAAVRRQEALRAISALGIPKKNLRFFRIPTRLLYKNLFLAWKKLISIVKKLQPDCILCPAFEGGHPDHDAMALLASIVGQKLPEIQVIEYALYNFFGQKKRFKTFITPPKRSMFGLSDKSVAFKKRALSEYVSQAKILTGQKRLLIEKFRLQPLENFGAPAHSGPLYYETWGSKINPKTVHRYFSAFVKKLGSDTFDSGLF